MHALDEVRVHSIRLCKRERRARGSIMAKVREPEMGDTPPHDRGQLGFSACSASSKARWKCGRLVRQFILHLHDANVLGKLLSI
jgi:hypothetical protein